ncbi:MAG: ribosome silencing factor [Chloroflexia bacterium]
MVVETRVNADPEQLARALVEAAVDRKAADIALLDLRAVTIISDYFVLCNGGSERQINALVRALVEKAGEQGYSSKRIEGVAEGGWVLLDFGDVIVHVFSPSQRAYYRLDELWSHAQPVLVIQ